MKFTYVHRKNPYDEQYDRMKVNEYLDLERLANILEILTKTLQGMFNIMHADCQE